jgi:hypothetical protein
MSEKTMEVEEENKRIIKHGENKIDKIYSQNLSQYP